MQKSLLSSKFKILSGSTLKLIAILSMLIDHIAVVFYSEAAFLTVPLFTAFGSEITIYYIMRKIGRLALPIFCFLASEGFLHTRNFKKYAFSLLIFALISEIPFDLMVGGSLFYPAKQNIYFTLLLGVLAIYIFENVAHEFKKSVFMIAIALLSIFLRVDYGINGTLLILLMYVLRKHAAAQTILSYPLLSGGVFALAAFIPINMYNGQRGFIKSNILKYGFYVFYPLHITVLVIIKFIISL